MPKIFKLTHDQIRARATDKVFKRGEEIFRDARLENKVQRGDQIEAWYLGTHYPMW